MCSLITSLRSGFIEVSSSSKLSTLSPGVPLLISPLNSIPGVNTITCPLACPNPPQLFLRTKQHNSLSRSQHLSVPRTQKGFYRTPLFFLVPCTRTTVLLHFVFTMSNPTSNQVLHPENPTMGKEASAPKERGQIRVLSDGSLLYYEPLTKIEGGRPNHHCISKEYIVDCLTVPAVRLNDIRPKLVQEASNKLSYSQPLTQS